MAALVRWLTRLISVEDRGFQFGDGVYEVIRTYRGQPFSIEAHLVRLERSAEALQLPLGYGRAEWTSLIHEGLRLSRFPETKIYLQITRGQAPRDHPFPHDLAPTTVLTFRELRPLEPSIRSAGVQAVTVEDIRWGRCDIKSVNLLANVLARQEAKEAGAFEAILVRGGHGDGRVCEQCCMMVRNGAIQTAPEGIRILSGVTRAIVLELARKEGLPISEDFVSREDIAYGVGSFFNRDDRGSVVSGGVDGQMIGDGKPGPVSRLLSARWNALIG